MMHLRLPIIVFLVLTGTSHGDEPGASDRIVSAGLFKNGLALLTREYTVPGPGRYDFSGVPEAVHGTLWIESDGAVGVRTATREVSVPAGQGYLGAPGESLTGKAVRLEFHRDGQAALVGTLLAAPPNGTHYVLSQSDGHRVFVDATTVALVRTEGEAPDFSTKSWESVLRLEIPESHEGGAVVRVSYLTRGASWAPGYKIDITDPARLTIQQSAILRNELEDLEDVSMELISGFPSVEYAHVISPLSTSSSWSNFFQQLNRPAGEGQAIMAQQRIISNNGIFMNDMGLAPLGPTTAEGADIYYHPIGLQTLLRNEALNLIVASAEVDYERVVEWNVPAHQETSSRNNDAPVESDVWDAIRFRNPFDFPMTTGPAMVVSGGRFLGSKTSHWVNPGDETLAYITKALSVRVDSREIQQEEQRSTAVAGHNYIERTIDGVLSMRNLRNEAVTMIVRKALTGELVQADGEPTKVVGEGGPGDLNPNARLTWTVEIPAGGELLLNYRYKFLVP